MTSCCFAKNVGFEIVSAVAGSFAQLLWTIGFVFLIVRRSARHSIKIVRLVEDLSVVVLGPFQAG